MRPHRVLVDFKPLRDRVAPRQARIERALSNLEAQPTGELDGPVNLLRFTKPTMWPR